ncbi:MAG: dihydrodipicolinate synthase family protein [Candidatus ainarchaeum sp.]|jgi:4-hydroxy-tetrahydrodipicolinate synthase|nr:dihydrodipicolinate synthase family protein [Candidatus ainarchaeum sp.]MDD4128732.1 dihydrodipicolinate synthase family protein [Candidatus ainarchaeum sp.]HPM85888.1 dihydrodipicolinate synthase family protein [archaeon]
MRKMGLFGKRRIISPSPANLSGLIVPLLTPLNEDKSIDFISLKTLVARLLNKGVKSFFLFGPYSEQEFLSSSEKEAILEVVFKEVNGKGFVLAGCFGKDVDEIVELVAIAEKFTNYCVVSLSKTILEDELSFIDFFDHIFRHTKTNILLYDDIRLSGIVIPVPWLEKIVTWERFIGIIEYSKDIDYINELNSLNHLTKLFEASKDMAFYCLRQGFCGIACNSSLIFPGYFLELAESMGEMDMRKYLINDARINEIKKSYPIGKKMQALKRVLFLRGLMNSYCFDDSLSLTELEKVKIEQAVLAHQTESFHY